MKMKSNTNLIKEIVNTLSKYSTADRLNVGAVLLKQGRIVATGYNGHPTKQPHKAIMDNGHDISTIHAEMNILCFCAKNGISTDNCVLVVSHYPCMHCIKHLYQAGIKEIMYVEDYRNDDNKYSHLIPITKI